MSKRQVDLEPILEALDYNEQNLFHARDHMHDDIMLAQLDSALRVIRAVQESLLQNNPAPLMGLKAIVKPCANCGSTNILPGSPSRCLSCDPLPEIASFQIGGNHAG